MILQAESIQLFVKPCVHWVILNDPIVDLSFWQDALSPYYTNHTLKFLIADWGRYKSATGWDPFNEWTGWRIQQLYKLLISKYVDDDYIVLDSKNFFIKSCSTEDWRGVVGNGNMLDIKHPVGFTKFKVYWNTIKIYAERLGCPAPKKHLAMSTPFVFDISLMKQIPNIDEIVFWINNHPTKPCEFLFYSTLAQHTGLFAANTFVPSNMHITFWPTSPAPATYLTAQEWTNDITVSGLHRDYLLKLNHNDIDQLNQWLSTLGFTNNIEYNI